MTDFDALPERKDSGVTGMAIPPTGNNALFNQPGIESRAKRRKKKACTCTTKAAGAPGEKIAPGITRIRGNLCNVHGRYGPCDKGTSGGKKPAKGRAAKKPAKTPEQRASERQATRSANADSVAQRMADSDTGLSPSGVKAMQSLASGQPLDSTMGDGLVKMGLAERGLDGSYRMSATGRAAMNAMAAGDYQRAVDTISRAGDAASARQGRQEAATARRTETATRRSATLAKRQAAQAERVARQAAREQASASSGNKKPDKRAKNPDSSSTPKPLSGLAKRALRRRSSPTAAAVQSSAKPRKPVTAKPENAPAKQIAPALRSAAQALSEGADVSEEQLDQLITNGLVKLNKDGDPVLTAAGQRASLKSFTVIKSSDGTPDRWLAITTSAYEDKDREIISTKAIARAVALGDQTGQRGPLRFWHVPGLDIGDCDFQAQGGPGGRFLIEGGTFRSKAFAQLGQTLADQGYQMSPGFVHQRDQPRAGVYDDIVIFERSAVPNGRAANHYTTLTAKEDKVLTPEKAAEYRTKAKDNPEALALLDTLLATTAKEDATAQDAKIAYKDAPEWAQAMFTRLDAMDERFKAFPPAAAEEVAEEVVTEEADDGMEMEAEDAGMDDAAFAQMIAQAVIQAITPLLDIEKKMAGHMADLKSTLGGVAQQKDDATQAATAAQDAQIAALDAKMKELTGDLPSSVMNGAANFYRPSQSPLTALNPVAAATMKEQISQVPAGLTDPNEIAAYQLIFGNS